MNNKKPHILIVDDKFSGCEVLRGLLSGRGYDLTFASSGIEALAKVAEDVPDLILLDIMMPEMDGFEVCHRLRADSEFAEIPILMITALDDRESRLRGIEAGADDFITKPFDQLELQVRVKTIIRLNRYRRLLLERNSRQEAEAEVVRRNRELTLLNQVVLTAATTLNVNETMYVACQALAQVFELPQATAVLLDETRSQFADMISYQEPVVSMPQLYANPDTISYENDASFDTIPIVCQISENILTYKAPLAIVAEPAEPRLKPVYEQLQLEGFGSLLIIPILIGDEVVGFFELKAQGQHYFKEQDLTTAQSIATAAGQCVETAQLYQNLQHHAEVLEETVSQRTFQLQTERDRSQAILEALGEAVVVTDTDGTVAYLNPAAVELTGFSEMEAIGKTWYLWQSRCVKELEIDKPEQKLYCEIVQHVSNGYKWQGEVNNKRKDGTLYDALLTVAPLLDSTQPDQIVGFVTVQSDITLLKEAERLRAIHQAQEKQAALDRLRHSFLSTVNHEMRTPLALIFQTLELLEGKSLGYLTEKQLDAVTVLRRQTWNLEQMVVSLIRVAAFLSKQETVRPVWAFLKPVFNNVLPVIEFKARSKEITIECDIAPDLPSFPLDVKQMEEVLIQLLDNAIKFNHPGGNIKICAYANDDDVIMAVSDTGQGIEQEEMNSIWDLFEQRADPLRRGQEGLGLGLALVRYIVEAHRGLIEIETIPGQGSTFTVKLPRTRRLKNKIARTDAAVGVHQLL